MTLNGFFSSSFCELLCVCVKAVSGNVKVGEGAHRTT